MDPVSGAVIGWLASQAMSAGQAKLGRVLRGDPQQNALRKIVRAAIGPSVAQVVAGRDRAVVEEALLADGPDTGVLETADALSLREAVVRLAGPRLVVLVQQGYGVDAGRLASVLEERITKGIQADAARGGPLGPVAELLRHERLAGTGEDTVEQLREVNRQLEVLGRAVAGGTQRAPRGSLLSYVPSVQSPRSRGAGAVGDGAHRQWWGNG